MNHRGANAGLRWATWTLPLLAFASCIASNVLAHEQRLVAPSVADLQFVAAPALQLEGLYDSVLITGEAALALRKVYYVFDRDGSYTAAALIEMDGKGAFQTLGGTWRSTAAGLELDGKEPVQLEQAPGHLRITAPNGSLMLRREELR